MKIGLVLFPELTQLDLTGPLEVFSRMPGAEVHLLWKTLDPVASDRGFAMLPTQRFDACTMLDLLCVPGGPGQIALMSDEETLAFLRHVAPGCRLVTSVCTGSLVLAAAGLLEGCRATSHWSSLDQLAMFGVTPVAERVVRDGNRITGAGVTSGIDFALTVAAEMLGEDAAREIQLQIEYDPAPPFASGSPRSADPALLERVSARIAPFIARRRAASEAAAARLRAHP
ncbi:DJ-1/PfpI family protein [Salipiger mangrovisoli]|uniref:DJ-1/PfpI family protein n=1 Tax=Salipiger mangrovisoli TaxID=2865933 RepID=A0ABR9WWB4_9RHOB|nr:DJ-1/PfpI family protein [Salipiger mangrovisoli]MBE9635579.1 DJ-1/PfpI family protein [Salipiger mangrovisoli]